MKGLSYPFIHKYTPFLTIKSFWFDKRKIKIAAHVAVSSSILTDLLLVLHNLRTDWWYCLGHVLVISLIGASFVFTGST